MSRYWVCGIEIQAVDTSAAAARIISSAQKREPLEVHLCNAFTLSLVDTDEELRSALSEADMNIPDGTPIAWLGRRWGTRGPVRGPGLMHEVVAQTDARLRHYLYGGNNHVAKLTAHGLAQRAPSARFVGAETPPFRRIEDDELHELAQRIRDSDADIVWVGLGTPRQDHLIPRLAPLVGVPVIPVGAAFDFWAGTVQQAPSWLHGSGFEWAYRLMQEPRRLWRRYTFGSARFILNASRHHVRGIRS